MDDVYQSNLPVLQALVQHDPVQLQQLAQLLQQKKLQLLKDVPDLPPAWLEFNAEKRVWLELLPHVPCQFPTPGPAARQPPDKSSTQASSTTCFSALALLALPALPVFPARPDPGQSVILAVPLAELQEMMERFVKATAVFDRKIREIQIEAVAKDKKIESLQRQLDLVPAQTQELITKNAQIRQKQWEEAVGLHPKKQAAQRWLETAFPDATMADDNKPED